MKFDELISSFLNLEFIFRFVLTSFDVSINECLWKVSMKNFMII